MDAALGSVAMVVGKAGGILGILGRSRIGIKVKVLRPSTQAQDAELLTGASTQRIAGAPSLVIPNKHGFPGIHGNTGARYGEPCLMRS